MTHGIGNALNLAGRTALVCGVFAIFALGAVVLWAGAEIFFLIFAGVLFGIFLRRLGGLLGRYLPVPPKWSVAIVLLAIAIAVTLSAWALAPSVQRQFEELSNQLPVVYENWKERLSRYPLGERVVRQMPSPGQILMGRRSVNVFGRVTGLFSTALDIVTGILVVLVVGIYLALHPETYTEGLVKLAPLSHERRAREVITTIGFTLRGFLTGISISMAINGALTFIGLWVLGVPFAVPLAILAGLFTFIPNIGPFISGAPAILIGLSQGPAQGLYVVLLYLAVQNFDGFVISPLIQQKAIAVPPVILIASQLLLAVMFGFLGLLLAVPIVAVLFVLVKMLYVEDVLKKHVEVKGEQRAKEQVSATGNERSRDTEMPHTTR